MNADIANHLHPVIKQRSGIRRPIESLAILAALDPQQRKSIPQLLHLLLHPRQPRQDLLRISIHEIILPSPTRNEKRETSNQPPATSNQQPVTRNQKPATSPQPPAPSPQPPAPSPQPP